MLLIESNKGWCQLVALCFLSFFFAIDNFDKEMYKDFLTTAFYSSFISAYKLRILKCKPHYLCHFTFVFISAGQITCFLGELESLVKNVTIRFGIT